jgi:hypothetical protein
VSRIYDGGSEQCMGLLMRRFLQDPIFKYNVPNNKRFNKQFNMSICIQYAYNMLTCTQYAKLLYTQYVYNMPICIQYAYNMPQYAIKYEIFYILNKIILIGWDRCPPRCSSTRCSVARRVSSRTRPSSISPPSERFAFCFHSSFMRIIVMFMT